MIAVPLAAGALHIYVRACTLCCFHGLTSTQTFYMFQLLLLLSNEPYISWVELPCEGWLKFFDLIWNLSEGADRVGGQLRGDRQRLFSGVEFGGRSVPERDARCVQNYLTIAKPEPGTLANPARLRGGKCVYTQVLLCASLGKSYFPCAKVAWSLSLTDYSICEWRRSPFIMLYRTSVGEKRVCLKNKK